MTAVAFIQVFLFVCFAGSGVSKLAALESFRHSLQSLRMIPRQLIPVAAVTVPLMEMVTGILLLIEPLRPLASLLLIVMLAGFSAVTAVVMKRKASVNCNCFGSLTNERIGYATGLRIAVFAVLTLVLLFSTENTGLFRSGPWYFPILLLDSLMLIDCYLVLMKLVEYLHKLNHS